MKDAKKEERTFLLCFHEVLKVQKNAVSESCSRTYGQLQRNVKMNQTNGIF